MSTAALVFGPNGGGKSTLLGALARMRELVLRSVRLTSAEFAERHDPHESEPGATEFAVDVLLGGARYLYSFAHDGRHVCNERLLVRTDGRFRRWFERHNDAAGGDTWLPFSKHFGGPRNMWRDATRSRALFLTTAAQLNCKQLRPLFEWFENGMAFAESSRRPDVEVVTRWIQDERRKSLLLNCLRAAGFDVHDVRVPEDSWCAVPPPIPQKQRLAVEFGWRRDAGLAWISSANESAGLKRMLGLMGAVLTAVERGQLLVVDDFDIGLHPLVARYVIQYLNERPLDKSSAGDRTAQLLLTSHDATLMDPRFIRRDQIWLMASDQRYGRVLSRLPRAPSRRKEGSLPDAYLAGIHGALPVPQAAPELDTAGTEQWRVRRSA